MKHPKVILDPKGHSFLSTHQQSFTKHADQQQKYAPSFNHLQTDPSSSEMSFLSDPFLNKTRYKQIINLIDICTQIPRDDRLILRSLIKKLYQKTFQQYAEPLWADSLLEIFVQAKNKKDLQKYQYSIEAMKWIQVRLRKYLQNYKKIKSQAELENFIQRSDKSSFHHQSTMTGKLSRDKSRSSSLKKYDPNFYNQSVSNLSFEHSEKAQPQNLKVTDKSRKNLNKSPNFGFKHIDKSGNLRHHKSYQQANHNSEQMQGISRGQSSGQYFRPNRRRSLSGGEKTQNSSSQKIFSNAGPRKVFNQSIKNRLMGLSSSLQGLHQREVNSLLNSAQRNQKITKQNPKPIKTSHWSSSPKWDRMDQLRHMLSKEKPYDQTQFSHFCLGHQRSHQNSKDNIKIDQQLIRSNQKKSQQSEPYLRPQFDQRYRPSEQSHHQFSKNLQSEFNKHEASFNPVPREAEKFSALSSSNQPMSFIAKNNHSSKHHKDSFIEKFEESAKQLQQFLKRQQIQRQSSQHEVSKWKKPPPSKLQSALGKAQPITNERDSIFSPPELLADCRNIIESFKQSKKPLENVSSPNSSHQQIKGGQMIESVHVNVQSVDHNSLTENVTEHLQELSHPCGSQTQKFSFSFKSLLCDVIRSVEDFQAINFRVGQIYESPFTKILGTLESAAENLKFQANRFGHETDLKNSEVIGQIITNLEQSSEHLVYCPAKVIITLLISQLIAIPESKLHDLLKSSLTNQLWQIMNLSDHASPQKAKEESERIASSRQVYALDLEIVNRFKELLLEAGLGFDICDKVHSNLCIVVEACQQYYNEQLSSRSKQSAERQGEQFKLTKREIFMFEVILESETVIDSLRTIKEVMEPYELNYDSQQADQLSDY